MKRYKKVRLTIGSFTNWRAYRLPKCVCSDRKDFSSASLSTKQRKLKKNQFDSIDHLPPPTKEEIKIFLSGQHKKISKERKLVVRRHLKFEHYKKTADTIE